MNLVSATTFLTLRAGEWAAIGAVIGGLATLGLLIFAARQLRGTIALGRANQELQRELLEAQTRPYVVANLEFRSIVAILSFQNIGSSPAFNVQVRLDERFESAASDADWQDSALFDTGLPMMAPTYRLRFVLDSLPKRRKSDLRPRIGGTISYSNSHGERFEHEPFLINLAAVGEGLQEDKTMHELVERVDAVNKTIKDWGKSGSGLRVNTVDYDRESARAIRPMHFERAGEARSESGWRGWIMYWVAEWRTRLGLHEW